MSIFKKFWNWVKGLKNSKLIKSLVAVVKASAMPEIISAMSDGKITKAERKAIAKKVVKDVLQSLFDDVEKMALDEINDKIDKL